MATRSRITLKVVDKKDIASLRKLSTEKLILWIVGKSREQNKKLSPEQIVIECWLVNPDKHSMRGFSQFPDSQTVQKRIGEMKGKKGLLTGSEMAGYSLSEISKVLYADLKALIKYKKVKEVKGVNIANRAITSIDEAPYKRLKKTPAYIKIKEGRVNEIVDTDILYFYGINWHSKKSFIQSRVKNINAVVKKFSSNDPILKKVNLLLIQKYKNIIDGLLKIDSNK